MNTLSVDLGERSYPIHVGSGLLGKAALLSAHIKSADVMVVSNETVAPLYLDRLLATLESFNVRQVVLPDGEQFKTLEVLNTVFDALLEARFGRDCTLIALGGGVVGDMTGFAAACYQRGVAFLQIPTTLLAQVDSSVGGKTGVNHRLGKNMIGAFHQPSCVLVDIDTLSTLGARELSAGLAEVIKYGLIRDADFFRWLENHMPALLEYDKEALAYAIQRSCEIKAEVVSADERESGTRALLNLGHTFGHAIETGLGYGCWLHGEAVAAGISLAAGLSQRSGWLDADEVDAVRRILQSARLPVAPPTQLSSADMLRLMAFDKKVVAGRMRLVLLERIGRAVLSSDFDPVELEHTLSCARQPAGLCG